MATTHKSTYQDILIVGAGVFGLSTALALLNRPAYNDSKITVIDSAKVLPNPVGSSVDASRIIRADYSKLSYGKLATLAQEHWRDQTDSGWGGQGRYTETGFVQTGEGDNTYYAREALKCVQEIAKAGFPMDSTKIQELHTRDEIRKASKLPGVSGDTGYANWNSGWADAEKGVAHAIHKIKTHPNAQGRISIKPGHAVAQLLFSDSTNQCTGVICKNGTQISADLTILATGAWTGSLFNLHNRCLATGQALAYLQISKEEQEFLNDIPVIINWARGTFVIAPRNRELKIARHGFGYRNPVSVQHTSSLKSDSGKLAKHRASVPRTDTHIPTEAEVVLREALAELFPPDLDPASLPPECPKTLSTISTRPFTNTRLCWYTDTPTGDFLIDWPPLPSSGTDANRSLFIATGGSGHGYKFLPILGEYIVDAVEGNLDAEYATLWAWPSDDKLKEEHNLGSPDKTETIDITLLEGSSGGQGLRTFLECKDGSRGGPKGMILREELDKGVAVVSVHAASKL